MIDEAFKAGESSVKFNAEGNRKYTIQFDTMIQVNDSTGNQRPVMFSNKESQSPRKSSKAPKPIETLEDAKARIEAADANMIR